MILPVMCVLWVATVGEGQESWKKVTEPMKCDIAIPLAVTINFNSNPESKNLVVCLPYGEKI